jgi:hypothetical protein
MNLRLGKPQDTGGNKKPAFLDSDERIELKKSRRSTTLGGDRFDSTVGKTKVVFPTIASRIE